MTHLFLQCSPERLSGDTATYTCDSGYIYELDLTSGYVVYGPVKLMAHGKDLMESVFVSHMTT